MGLSIKRTNGQGVFIGVDAVVTMAPDRTLYVEAPRRVVVTRTEFGLESHLLKQQAADPQPAPAMVAHWITMLYASAEAAAAGGLHGRASALRDVAAHFEARETRPK